MKMPTAEKTSSGLWRCRVMVDGKTISITKETKREAEKEAYEIKMGHKKEVLGSPKTLSKAIDDFIESRSRILSASTIRGYRCIQRTRFQTMMGREISADKKLWQRVVNDESKLCSPKTLKNAWGFVRTVIKEETEVALEVKTPVLVPHEKEYLNADEIKVFLEAIRGTDIEIPCLLALSSLRRSEVIGLRTEDVDLANNLIHVRGSMVLNEDNKLIRKESNKTSASRRDVPIIEPLRRCLESADLSGEYVVTMSMYTIYHKLKRLCEEYQLPNISYHNLRHSFASLAFHVGMSADVAERVGGWSRNSGVMKKTYTHLYNKDIEEQAQKFTKFFQ